MFDMAFGECAIEWERGQKIMTITAYNGSWLKNRIMKYVEEYPDEVKLDAVNKDGSIVAKVPVSYLKIRRPREISEEQREAARARFAQIREEKAKRQPE